MNRRVAALAALLVAGCGKGPAGAWVPVERRDLVLGVDVTGAMRSVDSTPIKPPAIGDQWELKIAQMVPEGEEVKAGDVAIQFDGSELMRQLMEMQNEAESAAKALDKQKQDGAMARKDQALAVAEADATLRKASLKSERAPDLTAVLDVKVAELDRKLAAMELEHARDAEEQGRRHDAAAIERLAGNLDYAQGRVREIQENIARMSVAAPRAGTVIYPTSWQGQKKKVGDSVWRMETALEIAALDKMVGDGEIDEVDSSRVRAGQPVTLRLDAHPDSEIKGKLEEIATIVQRQSQSNPSKVVKVKIALQQGGEMSLRPGMRFRGRVETGRVANAIVVPAEAVFITPGGPVAYRRTSGGWEKVELELGQRNDTAIEIRSGLSAGDEVSRRDLGGAR